MNVNIPVLNIDNKLPARYACDGDDISPPLHLSMIPAETRSLALRMYDVEAVFDHWVVWNVLPVQDILENSYPGVMGLNSFGKQRYNGPCPPDQIREYRFEVFALDIWLELKAGASREALDKAMQGHIVASGRVTAYYSRQGPDKATQH